ncbi:MAG: sugar nucleotide-binding protein [Planctomycetes bacterium]|nr:sugar nucleotide-binding protein [Planctomycetota bacterium]
MAAETAHLFITGGSGTLGTELQKLAPDAHSPSSRDFDVTDFAAMRTHCAGMADGSTTLIHAAAYIFTRLDQADPMRALDVNIIGTSNIVKLCLLKNWRLVYISTDYVFRGDKGGYREEDEVFPFNEYAWTKLGGECAVMMYKNSLVVRTSFGPEPFPFPKAFRDQWTSKLDVAVLADAIIRVARSSITGTLHVGSPRRTVLDYARSISPDKSIGEISRLDATFAYPYDTSLDCRKFTDLFGAATVPGGDCQ